MARYPKGSKQKTSNNPLKYIALLLAGFLLGFLLYNIVFPNKASAPKSSGGGGKNEISVGFSSGDATTDRYFQFKIDAPKSYSASSDQLLTNYLSQGGMAPPRLILNKGDQYFWDQDNKYLDKILSFGQEECISIWTTGGFGSIKDWLFLPYNQNVKLGQKEEVKIGKRTAELYKMSVVGGSVYAAYLPIDSANKYSYFFRTCNDKNKGDLEDIMKSLKLRVDANQ